MAEGPYTTYHAACSSKAALVALMCICAYGAVVGRRTIMRTAAALLRTTCSYTGYKTWARRVALFLIARTRVCH